MILLIDAEMLVMRAIAAHQQEYEWTSDIWSYECDVNAAFEYYKVLLDRLEKAFCLYFGSEAKMLVNVFGSPDTANFRRIIYPQYKAHRKRKPIGFKALMNKALTYMFCAHIPYGEGDDAIAHFAETLDGAVIASGDKDLDQIPGEHMFFDKKTDEIITYVVTEEEAIDNLHIQALMGDTTDNIPGLEGVGKVKARKMVEANKKREQPLPWREHVAKQYGDPQAAELAIRLVELGNVPKDPYEWLERHKQKSTI